MKVPGFIGGSDVQKSLNLSNNKCINLVPVTNDKGSITAFYKTDGLKSEGTLSGTPAGLYNASNNRSFYVSGTTLYELSSSLVSTSRGTVTSGTYEFSDNGIELICVNGTDGWLFTFSTNVLLKIKVLTANFTVTSATPAVVTSTAHGLVAGDRVLLQTTGFLPVGLLTNTVYFVISTGLTANAFQVSETLNGSTISTIDDFYINYNNILDAIAWNGSIFVAVASSGVGNRVVTSYDGFVWTERQSAGDIPWRSVAWNGTVFCAIASANPAGPARAMTSPDGITWTQRTTINSLYYHGIAWNGSLFVAVAQEGVGIRAISSPDGITWTQRVSAADNHWQSVCWNGSIFVAVASSGVGNRVMTSVDGINWIIRVSAADSYWRYVGWSGTLFIAVGQGTTIANSIMTSPDGITWTLRSQSVYSFLESVACSDTIAVAVGNAGIVMTSPDGITWTTRSIPAGVSGNEWRGVTWNGSIFVAVGDGNSHKVMTSPDGITWSIQNSYGTHSFLTSGYGFPNGCKKVSYMNGRFVAEEPNSQNFFVSEVLDGGQWDQLNLQTVDSNPDNVVTHVVSHNELIMFCEESGEIFTDSGTYPSPFVRNGSAIFEIGCAAIYSTAILDNTVFWLGQSKQGTGIVYKLNGYTPQRISTDSIEYSIQSMSTISDARAFSYQKDGHHFYVITFPTGNKTFVYDINTSLWHERASFISSTFAKWEPQFYIYFNGKHYVSDYNSTTLYSIDSNTYKNGANPLKIVRSFYSPSSDMKRVVHHMMQIEAEFGVTALSDPEAVILLRWSNDSGNNWSNEISRGIGAVGEYFKRVIFNRLGMTKGPARIYEISCTDNVKCVLINVFLE
jgi:hypothetical protein